MGSGRYSTWSLGRKLGLTAWGYVASITVNLLISTACVLLLFKPAFRDAEELFAQQQQLEKIRAEARRCDAALDRVGELVSSSPDVEAQRISDAVLGLNGSLLARSIEPHWNQIQHLITQRNKVRSKVNDPIAAVRSREFLSSLDELLSGGINALGALRQQSIYRAADAQAWIVRILVLNTGVGACLCVLGLWFVRRRVVQPVGVLKQAMARVRQGDFNPEVILPQHDELGKLGSQIVQMAGQIGHLQDRLVDRERQAAASEMVAHLEEHMRAPLSEIHRLATTGAANKSADREIVECQERIAETVSRFESWLQNLQASLAPARSDPRPVVVSDVLSDVLAAVRPTLERLKVKVTVDLDPAVSEVQIDRLQFEQALVALITNAAEASEANQTVRVFVRSPRDSGGDWELEVQDEGSGITPELIEKIFLPFFTTKRDGNGIGLGLVKAIVHQHGGTLRVHSEQGKGSRFIARLPHVVWPATRPA